MEDTITMKKKWYRKFLYRWYKTRFHISKFFYILRGRTNKKEDDEYFRGPELINDIMRAAEKGALAQDKVMKEAGMQWPSEIEKQKKITRSAPLGRA